MNNVRETILFISNKINNAEPEMGKVFLFALFFVEKVINFKAFYVSCRC